MENAEINNIIKIVGLQYKKSYDDPESLRSLRYGKIMIMTDQVTRRVDTLPTQLWYNYHQFNQLANVSRLIPGSRRLPHQRSSYQLLPPQLAVPAETHIPGGVHHAHCQSKRERHTQSHTLLSHVFFVLSIMSLTVM